MRRILGLLAGLLLVSNYLWAQPLPDRRTLTGRVMQENGKPLAGAVVTLRRDIDMGSYSFWGAMTVADAQGNFAFPDAEEDSYRITVEAPGFDPVQERAYELNADAKSWQVTLQRMASLQLVFQRPDGTPLPTAPVSVRLEREDLVGQPLRRQTDKTGKVTLESQKPASYNINAIAPGIGYAQLKNVNLRYEEKPTPIEVRLQPGGSLRVTAHEQVANGEGRPIGGATLSLGAAVQISAEDRAQGRIARPENMNLQNLYSPGGEAGGAVTRDGDGTLELSDLPPGRYTARLLAPGLPPQAWKEVQVEQGQTAMLDFQFAVRRPLASLEVLLRDKKNQPIASSEWNLQLRLVRENAAPGAPDAPPIPPPGVADFPAGMPGVAVRRAATDENGRFTLYPLAPGRWRLVLFPARDTRNARENRGDTYQRDVEIKPEGSSLTIVVNPPKP